MCRNSSRHGLSWSWVKCSIFTHALCAAFQMWPRPPVFKSNCIPLGNVLHWFTIPTKYKCSQKSGIRLFCRISFLRLCGKTNDVFVSDNKTLGNCRNSHVGVPTLCGIERVCSINWVLFPSSFMFTQRNTSKHDILSVYSVQDTEFLA